MTCEVLLSLTFVIMSFAFVSSRKVSNIFVQVISCNKCSFLSFSFAHHVCDQVVYGFLFKLYEGNCVAYTVDDLVLSNIFYPLLKT